MITIKKASKQDIDRLFNKYHQYLSLNLNNVHNSHYEYIIALDGISILGFCEMVFKVEGLPEIVGIYVDEEERNCGLGDGIFRTSLNYIKSKDYGYAICMGNKHINKFLFKEGLQSLKYTGIPSEFIDELREYNLSETFLCNIDLFFKKGCRSKKGS